MRTLSLTAVGLLVIAGVAGAEVARRVRHPAETDALVQSLLKQGVAPSSIVRIHPDGVPVLCQVPQVTVRGAADRAATPSQVSSLPAGTRGWETIPSVLRSDASDSCRLEVDVNGPVTRVTIDRIEGFSLDTPGPDSLEMRDDGLGLDRVAGDFIYTAGPFHYRAGLPFPLYYGNDPTSPAGLYTSVIGRVVIEETDHSLTEFLLPPEVGLLRADIPNRTIAANPAPDMITMPHLINLKTSTRETQKLNHFISGGDISRVTTRLYSLLPDAFDFLVFFSVDKIEQLPAGRPPNYNAGVHLQVQTNYTGTGLSPYAGQGYYGSESRLLSVNVLDAFDRGIAGSNVTHEITHQWAAYTNTALSDGTAHYGDCSVGSLVGGFLWIDNGNGTFTRNCNEGRNGAHHAPPLDLYMMGLIGAAAVPPQRVATSPGSCSQPVVTSWTTVTVADIQALHGVRLPKPPQAQKKFNIGFVAESHDRLLTATELTFFEILAEHYTKTLPSGAPDPYMGVNWPPVTRYFANGSKWESAVPAPRRSGPVALASVAREAADLKLSISPNPGPTPITLRWESTSRSSPAGDVRLEFFDLAGRRLRFWTISETPAGSARWDGRDDSGRYVGAGVYLCRLTIGNTSATQRFSLLD